jgi:hypothetical protein
VRVEPGVERVIFDENVDVPVSMMAITLSPESTHQARYSSAASRVTTSIAQPIESISSPSSSNTEPSRTVSS